MNTEPISPTQFRVGEYVFWENCPSCCEELAPFEITAIDGDYAKLDLINKPELGKKSGLLVDSDAAVERNF